MSSRANSRDMILDAAETVAVETGAANLSLDAVAVRAGFSKGGLLYHFPTKHALLQALIERFIEEHEETRFEVRKRLPDTPSRELKAHVRAWDACFGSGRETGRKRIHAALLAAVAHDSSIMEPLRKKYRWIFEQIVASGVSFERAAIVCLAVDGIMLMDVLDGLPFDEGEVKRIVEALLRFAGEADSE